MAINDCVAAVPNRQRFMVQEFLGFVLHNSYLQRNGVLYKQAKGVTMGTACAPPVANIHFATSLKATLAAAQHSRVWHG